MRQLQLFSDLDQSGIARKMLQAKTELVGESLHAAITCEHQAFNNAHPILSRLVKQQAEKLVPQTPALPLIGEHDRHLRCLCVRIENVPDYAHHLGTTGRVDRGDHGDFTAGIDRCQSMDFTRHEPAWREKSLIARIQG